MCFLIFIQVACLYLYYYCTQLSTSKPPADYLEPKQSPKFNRKAIKQPPMVAPFSANRKIQRSRSAENLLDENEYSYVVPREYASKTLNRPTRGRPPLRPPPPDPTKLAPKTPPAYPKPVAPARARKPSSPDDRSVSPKLNGRPASPKNVPTSPNRLPKQPEFTPQLKSPLTKNNSSPLHPPPAPKARPRAKQRP